MRGLPRWSALVLPVLATVLAAGCGGGGDKPFALPSRTSTPPPAAASSSGSASPATSSGASPSTQAQQVEQAVRDYYTAVNNAIQNGDLATLASKSTPKCGCRKLVSTIEKSRAEGRVEGGLFTLRSVSVTMVAGALATADTLLDAAPGRVVGPSGRVVDTVRGVPNARDRVILVHDSAANRWLFDEVTAVS